ncbi:MAG: esterase family protein [Actinomycetota bacterium]|nr:esterase family protein [Actinomycetota bacterium]
MTLRVVLALAAAAITIFLTAASQSPPNRHGAEILRFDIASRLVPGRRHEVSVVPPNSTGRNRPLLVFLHGRGSGGENSNLSSEMFAALARQGREAPDIVFADGGEASYWHDRAGGRWGSYVLREVIPASLRRLGADPRRVAIGGLSMGGFGALDLARLSPGRFCAVGADSAALWERAADTAPGAFDDAADFARHDLIALGRRGNPYGRTPLWLDVGTDDPFRAADTALAGELRARGADLRFHVWPGDHSGDYWRAHWGRYLSFYARALSRCTG